MGVFIKNKNKRVTGNTEQKALKIDSDISIPINEEIKVLDKRSISKTFLNSFDQKPSAAAQTKEILLRQVKPNDKSNSFKIESIKSDDKKDTQIDDISGFLGKFLDRNSISLSFIDLVSFKNFIKDKKIALVANSSDLLNYKNGEDIDNHDIVIRFNSFKLDSEYTGEKTTIHASIYLQDINLDYFVPIRIIVCNNVSKWANTLKTINKYDQTFILKYNHPSILNIDYKKPLTTGLNTLITLIKIGGYDQIDMYGFTFYNGGKNSILRTDAGLISGISNIHDYNFEREFIYSKMSEHNKKKNIITFYGNSTL
jgi:hypothetical protein